MNVEIIEGIDDACDAYVASKPQASIGMLTAWSERVVRPLGLHPFYLVARDGQVVRGILPLVQVRSWLFGTRMVSQAFSTYGGPRVDTDDVRDALYARAVKLARKNGCESIEFRCVSPMPYDLHAREGKMCFHLPLGPGPEELWRGFPSKVRNHVRKAEKSGLQVVDGGAELLDEFYRIYTRRMKQLGTPAYPRSLMRCILEAFPAGSRVFAVRKGSLSVAAGFTMWANGFVEIPWAASLVQHNRLSPSSLLYWSIIKYFSLLGEEWFDLGRSTAGNATHRFKKEWGPNPVDLHYQFWAPPGTKPALAVPETDKYRRRIELWKKLPLWATRILGPRISRNLP